MASVSGLSVKVSAAVSSFTRGMSRAQDAAGDTALALRRLSFASESAESNLGEVGRAAIGTSGMFSTLAFSTEGVSFAMGTLSTTISLTLIPALGALFTALIPVAATLGTVAFAAGGLAGAFGLIIGSGILAFGQQRAQQNKERLQQINAQISALKRQRRQEQQMRESARALIGRYQERVEQLKELQAQEGGLNQRQQKLLKSYQNTIQAVKKQAQANQGLSKTQQQKLKNLKETREEVKEQTTIMGALGGAVSDLKDDLTPLIVAFGEEFVPLIEDALRGIPELVENILDATGGMDSFAEALRDFGETAFNVLPDITDKLFELARDALPLVRDFGEWLLENGDEIFASMLETTKDVGPELLDLADTVKDLLPHLNDLGEAVLDTIIPGLEDLGDALEPVVESMTEFLNALETGDFSEFAEMDEITLDFNVTELDISAADLVGGAIVASAIVSAIGWPVIGAVAITGAIAWGKVQGGDVVGALTWGTITGAMVVAALGWKTVGAAAIMGAITFQNIAAGDLLGAMSFGSISGALILNVIFGAVSLTAGGIIGAVFAGVSIGVGDVLAAIFPNISMSEGDILGAVFAGVTLAAAGVLAAIGWPVIGAGGLLAAAFGAVVVTGAAIIDYVFPKITTEELLRGLATGTDPTDGKSPTEEGGSDLPITIPTIPVSDFVFFNVREPTTRQLTDFGPGVEMNPEVRVTVEGDTGVIEDVTTEVIAKSERNVNRNTGRTPNL